jgi:hypothetical protein
MVRREVERHRSRRLRAGRLDDRELVDALERATEPHKELSAIVERLERRLDLAASGASEVDRSNRSWADEIDSDAARRRRPTPRMHFSGHIRDTFR